MLKNGNYQLGSTLVLVDKSWDNEKRIALMEEHPVLKKGHFQGNGKDYDTEPTTTKAKSKKNDKSKQGSGNGSKAEPKQTGDVAESDSKSKS